MLVRPEVSRAWGRRGAACLPPAGPARAAQADHGDGQCRVPADDELTPGSVQNGSGRQVPEGCRGRGFQVGPPPPIRLGLGRVPGPGRVRAAEGQTGSGRGGPRAWLRRTAVGIGSLTCSGEGRGTMEGGSRPPQVPPPEQLHVPPPEWTR